MSDEDKRLKDDLKTLGNGVVRTFMWDVLGAGVGALIGGTLSYLFLDIYGNSFRLGAIVGVIVGVLVTSRLKPLFDYGKTSSKRDDPEN